MGMRTAEPDCGIVPLPQTTRFLPSMKMRPFLATIAALAMIGAVRSAPSPAASALLSQARALEEEEIMLNPVCDMDSSYAGAGAGKATASCKKLVKNLKDDWLSVARARRSVEEAKAAKDESLANVANVGVRERMRSANAGNNLQGKKDALGEAQSKLQEAEVKANANFKGIHPETNWVPHNIDELAKLVNVFHAAELDYSKETEGASEDAQIKAFMKLDSVTVHIGGFTFKRRTHEEQFDVDAPLVEKRMAYALEMLIDMGFN